MNQNLFPEAIKVAKIYANSIENDYSHVSSLYIVDCLEKAEYGFNQYLKARSEFEDSVHSMGEVIANLKQGESKNVGVHQDAMRETGLASEYHVRAIYAELWNAAETARRDLNGSFLPKLKGFKPRSLLLVRNNLLVHQTAKPETINFISLGRDDCETGYILFPDRDLDGKGTTDKGLFFPVQEYLNELIERMRSHV